MGARKLSQIFIVLFTAAAVPVILASPQQNAPPPAQLPAASGSIKTQTRWIAVDVVATDAHGAPVRGLQKEDFQIFEEHNREQQIAQFQFIDRAASDSQPRVAHPPATLFSNEFTGGRTVAPTVLLMDALNTEVENQIQVRQQMLALLNTLPPDTPVAIFSLGHTLHVVQSFSTDPKVLHAAIDRSLRKVPIEKNPQDDADSPSNVALDENGGQETQATQALEDFEAMNYEAQMAIRVDETTDAMIQISKYLGGYDGRKNLIWFSEAFPIWIEPSGDFGTDPFSGSAAYTDKVRAAAEALTDARVAVYPVDAKGLAIDQLYASDQNPHINRQNPGRGFGNQLARQNYQHLDQQATLDNIAETTGGRTCKNTNDLSSCVQSALNDGATYYELAYYPADVPWDGRFHKIVVKTTRRGVKLAYRRGYFATEMKSPAQQQKPEDLFKQTCMNPLPSTSIALSVQPVAPQPAAGKAPPEAQTRYLLTVSARALTFDPGEGMRRVNLQMAVCEFDPKEKTFQFFSRDLSRPVPDELYRRWQQRGIQDIVDYGAKPEDQRLRFVVLDVSSGETGAVDVPAHPRELASLPESATPEEISASAAPPEKMVTTGLIFRSGPGQLSKLEWRSGTVSYQGNLSAAVGALALFQKLVGVKYHCQSGTLVPNDPRDTTPPRFALVLENVDGRALLVDMTGTEPQYSGHLAIDDEGKEFFREVWKLCHCQQP